MEQTIEARIKELDQKIETLKLNKEQASPRTQITNLKGLIEE
jgi:hypothetical protein